MNIQNAIHEWLAVDGEYDQGLKLLEQVGCSSTLLTLLQRGENSYTRPKLTALLENAAGQKATPNTIADVVAAVAPTKATARRDLEQRAYVLMDERAELKARIRAVLDDDRQADRRDWAFDIKRLTRAIDALYEEMAFLDEHGYLPPAQVQEETTPLDDTRIYLNVRSYISKQKKKVNAAKPGPDLAREQAKLRELEAERDRLEKLLSHAV